MADLKDTQSMSGLSLVDKIRHDWITSENPHEIITHEVPGDILIDNDIYSRFKTDFVETNLEFKVYTYGRQLQIVAFFSNPQDNNFTLLSVSNGYSTFEVKNKKVWYYSPKVIGPRNEERKNGNVVWQYFIKIHFVGKGHGSYMENIIFGFDGYPIFTRKIVFDLLSEEDKIRLSNAVQYQLSQNIVKWADEECIIRFSTRTMSVKDSKEYKLSQIYPYPDKTNFFLSYETLSRQSFTISNYKYRLHELLYVEELARHELLSRYNQSGIVKIMKKYSISAIGDTNTISKLAQKGELFARLQLKRSISDDTKSGRLFLMSCNSALIKRANQNDVPLIFEVLIEDKCTDTVYLRLPPMCIDVLKLTCGVYVPIEIQFVLNRLSFCEWHRAIDCLTNMEVVLPNETIYENSVPRKIPVPFDHINSYVDNSMWKILSSILNAEQRKAIQVITSPYELRMPPILLIGPFGTGKTFAIAQAIYILLARQESHKILLCTHSDNAADLYVKEFFHDWYKNNYIKKPLRIFYNGRAESTVHPIIREYSLIDKLGCFRGPTDQDIRDCNLVITTLRTSSCLLSLDFAPTHIIIDEAAQALECEVLIPLAMADEKVRVILAGDDMQISPEIFSDLAKKCDLEKSILERMQPLYPNNHPCVISFVENHRSHKDIIKFASRTFYTKVVESSRKIYIQCANPRKSLIFYGVQGTEILYKYSTGFVNVLEVYQLVKEVVHLKQHWPEEWGPYNEGSIGVVSYYSEQVQLIRSELRKCKLFDVSVEKVSNVQGKQFTALFISTVRTRNCSDSYSKINVENYGFLTNSYVLNMVVTRARCRIVVFGDPVALLTIGPCKDAWRAYVEMAELQGLSRAELQVILSNARKPLESTPLNPLAKEFVPNNLFMRKL